jgi:hypothetical protein
MSEEVTIWERLQRIDRRVFYWVLFIGLMIPFIRPIMFPISISPSTRDLYEGMIEMVEPGDVVVLNIAFGVSAWPECMPAFVVCAKTLIREGAKLIIWGAYYDVDMTYEELLRRAADDFAKLKYGEDYVYIGYYPYSEPVVAQLASSIRSFFTTDNYGTPLDEMPMMKDVDKAEDITLVITCDTGDVGSYYIRQWRVPYGVPVAEVGIAMLGSSYMPFYRAGVLFGMSVGVRGGAELEKLIGEPAEATIRMGAINISHILVIIAVLLANIGYFASRGRK